MPTAATIAFDRSARTVDQDGRLHVARTHISKANVRPYYGREIPGCDSLGLDADKVYNLFLDPAELEASAGTFRRIPILNEHKPIFADDHKHELVVGSIGSDVVFKAPYLDADMCVWDSAAIAGIETRDVVELSIAYRYVPVMEPGTFEGQAYDGRMTQIRGNHLALVPVGRAGPDVVVADGWSEADHPRDKDGKFGSGAGGGSTEPHARLTRIHHTAKNSEAVVGSVIRKADGNHEYSVNTGNGPEVWKHNEVESIRDEDEYANDQSPTKPKVTPMKMTKLGKAIYTALGAMSAVLAADSAVQGLVAEAKRDTFDSKAIAGKLVSLDASLKPEVLTAAMDAMIDLDNPEAVVPAADKDLDEEDEEKKKTAMDAAITAAVTASNAALRTQLMEARQAEREVENVVGEVIGMDSAADIYGFALDHMKVDRKGVEGVAALRALFTVAAKGQPAANQETIAADAQITTDVDKRFGLARFRHG